MPAVSKYPLSKDVEKRVYQLLVEALTDARTPHQTKKMIDDLLTPTEKTMLAKRIAIALMLVKAYDYRSISQTLKTSLATVGNISRDIKIGSGWFEEFCKKVLKDEKIEEYFNKIDDFLSSIRMS